MAQTQNLQFVINAQNKADATLKEVGGSLDKLKANVESFQPAFKKMALIGTAAFAGISAIAISSFKASAEAAAEMAIATNTVNNALEKMSADKLNVLQKEAGAGADIFEYMGTKMKEAGQAAVKMAFDDEAAAQAYSKLFQITGDAKTSQEELNLAMDLARFSGRDLASATDALIKVHAGGTKVLKEFGITVEEGTTAEQAFAIVAERTAGSAQTFADSAAGGMERMKIQVDNLREAVGDALAPAFNKVMETLSPLIEKFTAWAEQNPDTLAKIILIVGAITGLVAIMGTLGLMMPAIIAGFTLMTGPIGLLVIAVTALAVVIFKNWDAIKAKTIEVFTAIDEFLQGIWQGIKDTFAGVMDFIMSGIDKVVGAYNKVKSVVSNVVGKITGKRAIGGPVSPGQSYLVGEKGPEMFTPNAYGRIATAKSTAGGGGINITITGNSFMGKEGIADMIGSEIVRSLQLRMKIS